MSVKMMRMICIPCILTSIVLFVLMFITDISKGYLLCGIITVQIICWLVQLAYIGGKKSDK